MTSKDCMPGLAARERLAAVEATRLLDAPPAENFDRLAGLLQRTINASAVTISLLTDDREFFIGAFGFAALKASDSVALSESMGKHVVATAGPVAVNNIGTEGGTTVSPFLARHDLRSCLAVPVRGPSQYIVGSLTVYDRGPRSWSAQESALLADFALSVSGQILAAAYRGAPEEVSAARAAGATQRSLWQQEEILALAEDSAGIGVWDHELATGMTRGTAQFFRIMGMPPTDEPVPIERLRALRHPADLERVVDGFRKAVAEHADSYESEYRILRPDGQARWVFGRGRIIRDFSGKPVRYSGVDIDITARKQAEAALRKSEQQLAAVLDNATVAVFLLNEQQQCIYMNAAAERLTGYRPEDLAGNIFADHALWSQTDAMHPLVDYLHGRAVSAREPAQGEDLLLTREAVQVSVSYSASPVTNEDGKKIGTIVELRDIRSEKEHDRRIKVLFGELNHRVKNLLTIVQSIVAQTLRSSSVEDHVGSTIESRLMAIAKSHDILTSEKWRGAQLSTVARQVLAGFMTPRQEQFALEGPDIFLRPETALAFSMAFHELATNAVKYGALSVPEGRVDIRSAIEIRSEDKLFRLVWKETGGPPVRSPRRNGFGSTLIERGLALELGGRVSLAYPEEGVVCIIEMPMEDPPAD